MQSFILTQILMGFMSDINNTYEERDNEIIIYLADGTIASITTEYV